MLSRLEARAVDTDANRLMERPVCFRLDHASQLIHYDFIGVRLISNNTLHLADLYPSLPVLWERIYMVLYETLLIVLTWRKTLGHSTFHASLAKTPMMTLLRRDGASIVAICAPTYTDNRSQAPTISCKCPIIPLPT